MNIHYGFLFFIYTLVSLSYISNDQSVEETFELSKNNNLTYCKSYLTKYGFLVNRKTCSLGYCCGGCFNRYCCSTSTEKIKNENDCLNYDLSPTILRKLHCEAFVDKEGSIINGFNCPPGYFCSGSCNNRYCDNKEYNWLNQLICYNPKLVSSTIKTTIATKTSSSSTKAITKFKPAKRSYSLILTITTCINVIIITGMLACIVHKCFCVKKSNVQNQLNHEMRIRASSNRASPIRASAIIAINEISFPARTIRASNENDQPPPYPGF